MLLQLSQSLRVTTYPYNALLAFSGSRIRLIAAAEGAIPPTELLSMFQQAQDRQAASLVAEQAEQNEQVWAILRSILGSDLSHDETQLISLEKGIKLSNF